jgi:CheY-like chemotaxis protein
MVVNVPIHIVVAVDDDFRVRESLESLIESAGYEPVVFSSAEEFLQSGTLLRDLCDYRRSDARNGWHRVAASHQARASRRCRLSLYLPT